MAKGSFGCLLHRFSDQARGLLWRDNCNTYLQVERRMLLDQHLYPPNIAETLAALQRGPDALQPGSSSRYALQVCHHQAHARGRHAVKLIESLISKLLLTTHLFPCSDCDSTQEAGSMSGHLPSVLCSFLMLATYHVAKGLLSCRTISYGRPKPAWCPLQ